jgi:galactokinase
MHDWPVGTRVIAVAPGRVNLIGDHTDYTGGLVLPMAIDLATTVTIKVVERGRTGDAPVVELVSSAEAEPAIVRLEPPDRLDQFDPSTLQPLWARYVSAVAAGVRLRVSVRGTVHSTLPIGEGLSSSAALEVALALAFGFEGSSLELALATQRAEHRAVGVPCGIMDQLISAAGLAGHALRIDCTTMSVEPVPLPPEAAIWIVPSGHPRTLATSAYAERRMACERAAAIVGPLRGVSLDDLAEIADPTIRRRARHVVTENERVRQCVAALHAGDLRAVGEAMRASHRSLRDDFEVSTAALDDTVARLIAMPGVYGARLTGAGFGGSVVALCTPEIELPGGRRVVASAGAHVRVA